MRSENIGERMASLSFEPLSYHDIPEDERPTLLQALVPVVGMLVFLSVGAIALGLDVQFPLVWGIVLTGLVGRYWIGLSWNRMYEGIVDSLSMGMQALLIIFVIYTLIAVWTGSGTIPTLIYYGLDLLSPSVFLPAAAALAAVVAFAVGSSWTTAGTLGVAFVGIGTGLGVPAPMTAGAVLSGAYTGDKISPLSDTTNLAAAVTNTDLYTHIRTMRVGTSIAFGLSLVGYAVLGLTATGSIPAGRVAHIQHAIAGSYVISPLTFFPLVLTFALALYGFPALPSLATGIFAGVFTQIFVQSSVLGSVANAPLSPAAWGQSFGRLVPAFTHAWSVAQSGASPETGMKLVNDLLSTNGLVGSAWTITVVVAALSLGGILERTGVLATLAYYVERVLVSPGSLVVGTAVALIGTNILAAEQYMSIVVPGMSFRGLYDDFDLESRNLSRSVEAAGTTTSALIPWNSGGVYMASVFGVPTLTMTGHGLVGYAPYYFFGILSPLVLVVMGITGWRITYQDEDTTPGLRGIFGSVTGDSPADD